MRLYAATFLAFHSDSQVSILTTPRFRLYSGRQALCHSADNRGPNIR